MPPYAYYKKHRLIRAAAIIILGEKNMEAVANEVGYESASKFAIAFKELFGVRPKHFISCLQKR